MPDNDKGGGNDCDPERRETDEPQTRDGKASRRAALCISRRRISVFEFVKRYGNLIHCGTLRPEAVPIYSFHPLKTRNPLAFSRIRAPSAFQIPDIRDEIAGAALIEWRMDFIPAMEPRNGKRVESWIPPTIMVRVREQKTRGNPAP